MAMLCVEYLIRAFLLVGLLFLSGSLRTEVYAEPISVVHVQGMAHGFLTLRTLDGKLIATGDLIQVSRGDRVTSRLSFHFRDGSSDEETTVYLQRRTMQFVSDRVIQRGPVFPEPMDALVLANGDVTIRSLSGETKVTTSHLDLPPDTSNGMIFSILMNLSPSTPETKVAFVAPTGKGRLVHLSIKPDGRETFTAAGARHEATIFRMHVELGGIAGVVAPVIGKQPEDIRAWVLEGEAPVIVKVEGQLYEGGPVWRMEMVAPAWSSR